MFKIGDLALKERMAYLNIDGLKYKLRYFLPIINPI